VSETIELRYPNPLVRLLSRYPYVISIGPRRTIVEPAIDRGLYVEAPAKRVVERAVRFGRRRLAEQVATLLRGGQLGRGEGLALPRDYIAEFEAREDRVIVKAAWGTAPDVPGALAIAVASSRELAAEVVRLLRVATARHEHPDWYTEGYEPVWTGHAVVLNDLDWREEFPLVQWGELVPVSVYEIEIAGRSGKAFKVYSKDTGYDHDFAFGNTDDVPLELITEDDVTAGHVRVLTRIAQELADYHRETYLVVDRYDGGREFCWPTSLRYGDVILARCESTLPPFPSQPDADPT